ncbi:MAG: hypothetical protein HOB20_06945, partial [Planctomycetaceae bacterium]|nr:hypothetical protein [Planctomycetaceae bacterium]
MQENWIRWSFALLLVFGTASLPAMADEGEAKAEATTKAPADSDESHKEGHDDHDG